MMTHAHYPSVPPGVYRVTFPRTDPPPPHLPSPHKRTRMGTDDNCGFKKNHFDWVIVSSRTRTPGPVIEVVRRLWTGDRSYKR